MAPLDPTDLRRPVLGRTHHAGHPARPHRGLRRVFRRFFLGERDPPRSCSQLTARPAAEAEADLAGSRRRPEPAPEQRGGARPGSGSSARTSEMLRQQVVRRLHARGARRAAADHGADPARPRRGAAPGARVAAPRGRRARPAPHRARDDADARRAVHLFWRRRRLRLRPLILILDVSGSMADYSRNLLQFAHSARRATRAGRGVLLRHPADPDHPARSSAAGSTTRWRRPPSRSSTGRAAPGSATRSTRSYGTGAGAASAAAASW